MGARRTVQADAIVLRTVPFGESDLIVSLLVERVGRVGAFARGARRSSKRFAGAIEPFCVLAVEYVERPRSDLADLRSTAMVTSNTALRTDLASLAHAGYATELVRELARENEGNDALYRLLVRYFELLKAHAPSSVLLRAFELEALGGAGLAPSLHVCRRCGVNPERDVGSALDVRAGGVACARCNKAGAPLGPAPLALLRALQAKGVEAAARAQDAELPLERVRGAMRAFIEHHVPTPLRSLAFLQDVGAPL